MTQQISDAEFKNEVLGANGPVVVDFWAEWCGLCKALSPIVDEVAGEMEGKIKMVKVNIDENPQSPTQYGVRGIPTLIAFKDGKVLDTKIGGMSKAQLVQWIDSLV